MTRKSAPLPLSLFVIAFAALASGFELRSLALSFAAGSALAFIFWLSLK